MTPLPKRKTSQGRRNRRRSHDALQPPALVPCTQCHELKLPHQVCLSCGSYRGVEVIEVKSKKKK